MFNILIAHVLFYSGATQLFASLALSKKFYDAPKTLYLSLEVEIADDHTVSASMVFHGCVLNLFNGRFSIDLVQIPMRGLKVIFRMNWLGPIGAMIDCE